MLQDLRFALRSLRKAPGFTAVAVLTLGLGLGANTTVFSLVNAIYFRPLSFPDAARLVDVHEESATKLCAGCGVGTSYPGFQDWQRAARSFSAMAGYSEDTFTLSGDGAPERIGGGLASWNLLPVLGASPVLGRRFTAEDDRIGAEPVVLLGHDVWRRRYGSDPAIVGKTVRINGTPHTVVGVMPPRFKYPEFSELWVPLVPAAHQRPRDDRRIGVVARLAPGVGVSQADAEMKGIGQALEREHPETQAEWTAGVVGLRDDMAADDSGNAFLVLLGAVGFVLLIVCANLTALLLSRATARRREIAIRLALGAGRGRLLRQLMTESLAISLAGGLLGFGLALWGVELVRRGITEPVPYWIDFSIDVRVLGFCLLASVLAGALVGLVPALGASRPDLTEALKDGAPSGTGSLKRNRLRGILVVTQMALALVLLSGAGLMVKTFLRVTAPPSGYDARNLLMADLSLVGGRYQDPAQIPAVVDAVVARLAQQPAVLAGASHMEFLAGFGTRDRRIEVEGMAEVPDGASPRFAYVVTPGFFTAQGLRLLEGRDFTPADRPGGTPVVIINQQLARTLWPQESALGKHLRLTSSDPWGTVVGVVGNVDGAARPVAGWRVAAYAYLPLAQRPGGPVQLLLRAPVDPRAFAAPLRAAVKDADPDLPVENIRTAEEDIARRYWPVRFFAVFLTSFAAFAVLLSAIGTYGVLAYLVSQRTREIGIRLAAGADRADILRLVLRQGAWLGGLGVALGLGGSALLTPVIRGILFGTSPVDPLVMLAVALLLGGVTLLASYLPARRGARVEPMVALRYE